MALNEIKICGDDAVRWIPTRARELGSVLQVLADVAWYYPGRRVASVRYEIGGSWSVRLGHSEAVTEVWDACPSRLVMRLAVSDDGTVATR